jgi:toxin ParE1/3/4
VKVRFSAPARADIDRIFLYVRKTNPAAAARVTRGIRLATQQLADFPLMAPETDLSAVHAKLAIPYPYVIFYTIRRGEVLILHIRHAARQPPSAADL